jgi:hypothetical protein
MADFADTEEKYKVAMLRYLRGKGIVHHRLLPEEALTDTEKSIDADDPCARALMFLLTVTGSLRLPKDNGFIDVSVSSLLSSIRAS